MKQTRWSNIPKIDRPELNQVLVRSQSAGGYWGRGATVAEAITKAQYLGSQDRVFVVQCDAKAHCDPITGGIRYNHRGPIYEGRIMRNNGDVLVSGVHMD